MLAGLSSLHRAGLVALEREGKHYRWLRQCIVLTCCAGFLAASRASFAGGVFLLAAEVVEDDR